MINRQRSGNKWLVRMLLCSLWIMCVQVLLSGGARAQNPLLSVDVVSRSVDITAGFSGHELYIYGMTDVAGDVVIVISGPEKEMVVRHKEELFGIWMNRESVKFDSVPVYYDYAVSRPLDEVAPRTLIENLGIGLDAIRLIHTGRESPEEVSRFREALIRNKQAQGYYALGAGAVNFIRHSFFKVGFYLPSDVPTGEYTIRSYLFQDGKMVDKNIQSLSVAQAGLGARLNYFAFAYDWLYGLMVILFGIFSGWLAYVFLNRGNFQ